MTSREGLGAWEHLRGAGDPAAVDASIAEMLAREWRDPGVRHLAGVRALWRARELEDAGDAERAAVHWDSMTANLVSALEDEHYLEAFQAAREVVFACQIDSSRAVAARAEVYRWIDDQFQFLINRYAAAQREDDRRRVEACRDRFSLEIAASELVRELGGVPSGDADATLVVAGPAFAAAYGFADAARERVEKLRALTSPREEWSQLIAVTLGSKRLGAGARTPTETRREAAYCFSHLALPYLHWRQRQFGRALDGLARLGDELHDGAPQAVEGTARRRRADARHLAVHIQLEVGAAHLQGGAEKIVEGLAYWGEAIKNVDALDAAAHNPLDLQGEQVRRRMRAVLREQVDRLVEQGNWDRALRLTEEVARIIPREESIRDLTGLLYRMAARASKDLDDDAQAAALLQRAELLAPHDGRIKQARLVAISKAAHHCLQGGEMRRGAEFAMDLASLASRVLADHPQHSQAKQARELGLAMLGHVISKMERDDEREFLPLAVAFFLGATKQDSRIDFAQVDGARLARRAQERFQEGSLAAAFMDVDEALHKREGDLQLRALYEGLASRVIAELCERGDLQVAEEVAQRASNAMPDSAALKRARTRLVLRRLDVDALLSDDPEALSRQVTVVENWLGSATDEQEARARGRRCRAAFDPAAYNEIQLQTVQRLVDEGRYRRALHLIGRLELEGHDEILAAFLRTQCHRFLGELDEALAAASALVERRPELLVGYRMRARVLSLLGRFDEAEEQFTVCRESDPENCVVLQDIGYNAFRARHWEDALADLRLARRSEHNSWENGDQEFESFLVESTCLMYLGRHSEIPALIAEASAQRRADRWHGLMFRWACGEVDDGELRASVTSPEEQLMADYFLGERARSEGRLREGNALIAGCLSSSLPATWEFEHARALQNSGILGRVT